MYKSGNNQALLNMTGLDHDSFSKLLKIFKDKWENYTFDENTMIIRKKRVNFLTGLRGRPIDLDAVGGLGLVLTWFCTKGPCNQTLVMIFGQTSTPLYKWLKFARCVLLLVVTEDEDAQICSPTAEEVASFQAAIGAKYPYCADVWGAFDGLKASI